MATKGSISSQFPDDLPVFGEQDEQFDPVTEDPTIAEARDANKWSAEIEAIAAVLGIGGRGLVSVSAGIATVERLKYVYRGTQYEYPGTTNLALTLGAKNYIYLDLADNTAKKSTTAFPGTSHIRLAIWDDSGSGTGLLTDERPHDLRPTKEQTTNTGVATIAQGNTSVTVTFDFVFFTAPVIGLAAQKPSDNTLRIVGFSSLSENGVTIEINTAAPAGGVVVHWTATGIKA